MIDQWENEGGALAAPPSYHPAWRTRILLWAFLKLGSVLFPFVSERNSLGRTTAIFFALNEREMNINVRAIVEWLDNNNQQQ